MNQTSFAVGAINFFFGLPAVFLIDKWGRRKLLLLTFPFMALCLALVAIGSIPSVSKNALVLVGMYLFAAFYSPGEGPVPFVYAAESFPQATRDLGMGVVTSIVRYSHKLAPNILVSRWSTVGFFQATV